MKTVKNKKTTLAGNPDYFKLIELCMNEKPKEGFTIKEMKRRIRALETLKGKKADIEDNDFKSLKSCVESMKWGVIHKDIVEFVEYITSL